mgnify:CR=1 FL=1
MHLKIETIRFLIWICSSNVLYIDVFGVQIGLILANGKVVVQSWRLRKVKIIAKLIDLYSNLPVFSCEQLCLVFGLILLCRLNIIVNVSKLWLWARRGQNGRLICVFLFKVAQVERAFDLGLVRSGALACHHFVPVYFGEKGVGHDLVRLCQAHMRLFR